MGINKYQLYKAYWIITNTALLITKLIHNYIVIRPLSNDWLSLITIALMHTIAFMIMGNIAFFTYVKLSNINLLKYNKVILDGYPLYKSMLFYLILLSILILIAIYGVGI